MSYTNHVSSPRQRQRMLPPVAAPGVPPPPPPPAAPGAPPMVAGLIQVNAPLTVWLSFVVQVRREMPNLQLDLHHLYESRATDRNTEPEAVPTCTTTWLMTAASAASLMDTDRLDRLTEDFQSFVPLWQAEESDRGTQAAADWSHMRATLCDEAMKSRWGGGKKRRRRQS